MNPTLYDILGVGQDATQDEVKRAWREAADRFDPGSGGAAQFKLFNEAAEVLLDPNRRAEYDARLAAERPEQAADEADAGAVDDKLAKARRPAAEPARKPEAPATKATGATAAPESTTEGTAVGTEAAPSARTGFGRQPVPVWLIAVLGGLAVVLVAVAAWLGLNTWDIREVHRHGQVADATQSAPAVAERASATILSYDYRSLDRDEKAAERYMTPGYAKKYSQTFDKLVRGNAQKLNAHVTATVRSSGVTQADPDRASVLLFVDQSTVSTANGGQKQTALNRVAMSMVRQNGTWLVDDITSY